MQGNAAANGGKGLVQEDATRVRQKKQNGNGMVRSGDAGVVTETEKEATEEMNDETSAIDYSEKLIPEHRPEDVFRPAIYNIPTRNGKGRNKQDVLGKLSKPFFNN